MRILVVEDDEIAAEYVRKGLMEAGHVVDLAPDGDLGWKWQGRLITMPLFLTA